MAKFKVRRIALLGGGVQVGDSGNSITAILAGSTSACVPGINASTFGTGSMAISGVDTNDNVFVVPASSNGIAVVGVVPIAGGASLSFYNMSSTNGATSTMTFRYFVFSE